MDVFELRKQVVDDYARYVRSFVAIRDERIDNLVKEKLDGGFLWPEPLIQLNPAFEPGERMQDLVSSGLLHRECLKIFASKSEEGTIGAPIRLHQHQVAGIRAARARDNYILTTGTGSGKSLSYIVPIVDHVLRNGSGRGIQAIIVYPMNALANSQIGELEKFLCRGYPNGRPPVTFRRYTGQEKDAEKREIIANPPDILLTNYVMLELVLTRTDERELVDAAKGLKFLVLDELHTYRGRQGADVALLVRRVREACEADNLLCIGTSATLASDASWSKQQLEVSRVATSLFGTEVKPDRVIGETLRRVTPPPPADSKSFSQAIRARIEAGNDPPAHDAAAFIQHPLSIWLESNVGLREDRQMGRLVRGVPRPLFGKDGAATQLANETGLSAEICGKAIERALLAGYHCTDKEGRPLFAFRLHQFVSKGESVYASLDSEESRYLTLEAQQFVPGSNRESILLPVAFCRECGQEYYVVRRGKDASGKWRYSERELSDRLEDDDGAPGYLYLNTVTPWPSADSPELLRSLPDTWVDDDNGRLVIRKSVRDKLPREVFLSTTGIEGQGTQRAHFIEAPFRFCLHCGVTYDARQSSDFGKLSTLASEGRSTATTILTLSTIRRLRQNSSLEKEAQKLLSFTDNRQDASLQAGHFNDFVEIGLLRSALYQAVLTAGPAGIRHDQLPMRVFEALSLPISLYAVNPEIDYMQRDETERALRQVIGHYLYRDLRRGWRVTSPNLEQCGLLDIDYLSLDRLCADEPKWKRLHPVLASASPAERATVCRVLCDFMRRELAIRVEYLDPGAQEGLKQQSNQYLVGPWSIDENDRLEQSRIVFPGSRKDEKRPQYRFVYLSPLGGFGRYVKRAGTLPPPSKPLKTEDVAQIIRDMLDVLTNPGGILHRVVEPKGKDELPGYQLNASALVWRAGKGDRAFHDPVRVPNAPEQGLRVNPFFGEYYREDKDDSKHLEAHEHTAQVPADKREEREEAFREGRLPVLYCSPTMELGVDIRQLNVVNMRNVPPTPANYAQRSGRAGRSGQPAFVLTYCSSGSPHDQYFFRRPQQMVAGAVAAPRLDLQNEDLVRAHVHAVWLAVARMSLGRSLSDVLDVAGENPTLEILPAIRDKLEDRHLRERALVAANKALGEEASALVEEEGSVDAWLERVLRELPRSFEQACERFRGLYRAALSQFKEQSRRSVDASRDARDREMAKSLQSEAYKQLQLLLEQGSSQQSDFYSYRYFASEGFLPGYNFPRLPLVAYIGGRRRKRDTDEFLSRPRFLAISEFGPRSIIYHEGSKFEVRKVILPVEEQGGALLQSGALCSACGYLHPLETSKLDICERCKTKLPAEWNNLLRMQNVSTRRRARINSDEEERIRLGYEIKTGIRFAQRHGTISAQTAILQSETGEPLATLTYGHSATVWRMNLGWRRRSKKESLGYELDLERGLWANSKEANEDDEDRDDPKAPRTQRVIPYVEDHRNCLLIEPSALLDPQTMASLEAALKAAVQVEFQVEDRELATEPLPSSADRRMLLLYEASEGGAGILRRLVEDSRALCRVARKALELCHYDPASLEDEKHAPHAQETCESACYDCLRSYFNQRDHELLDRKVLRDLLASWARGAVETSPSTATREEHKQALWRLCQSDLETRWLDLVDELGLRLPTDAQALIEACNARPDFLYRADNVAIFIDGPHHDTSAQRALDRTQEAALVNRGSTVIRFHHAADWEAIFAQYPSIFGKPTAKSEPPPQRTSPIPDAPTAPSSYNPEQFERRWHPMLDALCAVAGVRVEPGEEVSRGGRLLGETIASVHRGGLSVHLVDASLKTVADVVSTLEAKGARVLRIRENLPDLASRILAMLA